MQRAHWIGAVVVVAAVAGAAAWWLVDPETRTDPSQEAHGVSHAESHLAPRARAHAAEPAPVVAAAEEPSGTISFRLRAPAGATPAKVVISVFCPSRPGLADIERPWSDDALRIDAPTDTLAIRIAVAGCVPTGRMIHFNAGTEASLGEIALEASHVFEGHVVDALHRPVAGALAAIRCGDLPGAGNLASTRADDDGVFRFAALPAGEFELRVESKGFLAEECACTVPAASGPLIVTLCRGAEVKGTVRDADGRPIPGLTMAISAADSGDLAFILGTGESASFCERLRPGRWRFVARDADRETVASREASVEEGVDATVDLSVER